MIICARWRKAADVNSPALGVGDVSIRWSQQLNAQMPAFNMNREPGLSVSSQQIPPLFAALVVPALSYLLLGKGCEVIFEDAMGSCLAVCVGS